MNIFCPQRSFRKKNAHPTSAFKERITPYRHKFCCLTVGKEKPLKIFFPRHLRFGQK